MGRSRFRSSLNERMIHRMARPLLSTILIRGATAETPTQDGALVDNPMARLAALGVAQVQDLSAEFEPLVGPAADDAAVRGRYRLGDELGRGGMGRVVRAEDGDLHRAVAVKELHVDEAADLSAVERFAHEARVTAQLGHPAIVPVHELGLTRTGHLFYAMKLVRGTSLGQILRNLAADPSQESRWPRFRLLGALLQVGRALQHAHDRGVLHMDVKPENIMLGDEGEVYLMDWGLAERFGDAGVELRRGIGGTPGYMPPELFAGDPAGIGPWSDVFAFGAVLYETLVCVPAIRATTLAEFHERTVYEAVPDPRHRHPTRLVPEELAELCNGALQRDRMRRTARVLDVVQGIERWLDGSRRSEEAARRLVEAEDLRLRWEEALLQVERHLQAEDAAGTDVKPWWPLERKAPWYAARRRRQEAELEAANLLAAAVGAGERALAADPKHAPSRAWMARLWWAQREVAEAHADASQVAFTTQRVAAFDDGPFARRLAGLARLQLHTDPPGAEAVARPYDRNQVIWSLGEPVNLGRTPLTVDLPPGSWLIELRVPGRSPVAYPVLLRRGVDLDTSTAPVEVPPPEAWQPGFCFVPRGAAMLGGDRMTAYGARRRTEEIPSFFVSTFPVTAGEYLRFLQAIERERPGEAARHAPRKDGGLRGPGQSYWSPPPEGQEWTIPSEDPDGSRWVADWPVLSVSWFDAVAYCAWWSRLHGRNARLPFERELEKAGRGADGRLRPWGDQEDAALCYCAESNPGGTVSPAPVGLKVGDTSPYGVRDLAGGVREWCMDECFEGDPNRRPAVGGGWTSTSNQCRLTNRFGFEAGGVRSYLGFRLAYGLTPRLMRLSSDLGGG